MPPITRHQLKKTGLKTEPYSKENRPLDRRAALLDLVSNNVTVSSFYFILCLNIYVFQNHKIICVYIIIPSDVKFHENFFCENIQKVEQFIIYHINVLSNKSFDII